MEGKIKQEQHVVELMVRLFCRNKHKHLTTEGQLCEECRQLLDYAHKRLEHCKFGKNKTTCRLCSVHCYQPQRREQIRQIMRWAGPRMMLHHPIIAIKHLIAEKSTTNQ